MDLLCVRHHLLDDLRIRISTNLIVTEMSHSLCRSLAQDMASERLLVQYLAGARNLESLLG